jgi:hypothetical protein
MHWKGSMPVRGRYPRAKISVGWNQGNDRRKHRSAGPGDLRPIGISLTKT